MHKTCFNHFKILSYLLILILGSLSAEEIKLELSPNEKAFINNHENIQIGIDGSWAPYIFKNDVGEFYGFQVDILNYINEVTGLKLQLVLGPWNEIVQKAQKWEIDGLAASSVNEDRRQFFNFTDNYAFEYPTIIASVESKFEVNKISDLSGEKIAIQEGNKFFLSLVEPHPDIIVVKVKDEIEGLKYLMEGKVSTVLSTFSTYYSNSAGFGGAFKIINVLTENPLEVVFSIRKDYPELVSIINKAISSMPNKLYNEILDKWFVTGEANMIRQTLRDLTQGHIDFSPEEINWIKEHSVVRVANAMDWAPFDYNVNGEPKGFSIDLLQLIAMKAGFRFEFIYGYNWAEMQEKFKNKEIDVLPLIYKNDEREKYISFTEPYLDGNIGVFTNSDDKDILFNYVGAQIGMLSANGAIPLIKKKLPGINIIELPTQSDLVLHLATNKLDAIIDNPFVIQYLVRKHHIQNIILTDFIDLNDQEKKKLSFHMGVQKDLPELHSIIDRVLKNISDSEMNTLMSQWANTEISRPMNWKLILEVSLVLSIIFTYLVVSNRKLARREKEISTLKRESDLILGNANEGICRLDNNGNTQFINPEAERLIGWEKSEVLGKNFHELVHHSYPNGSPYSDHDCPINKSLKLGEIKKVDTEVFWRKDGSSFPVEYVSTPINDENGELVGGVLIFRDITTRKQYLENMEIANVKLMEAKEIAEKSDFIKSTFLANMSHEIRTPISSVMGFTDILQMEGLIAEEWKEYLKIIKTNSSQLLNLINDILDISKLDSNQLKIIPEEINVNTFMNEIKEQAELLIKNSRKNIHFIMNNKITNIDTIYTDKTRLHQVINNLLSNALKFTESGQIDIELTEHDQEMIKFQISDTGVGIKKEDQEHIFTRFGQSDHGLKYKSGSGLGLSIAAGIVDLLGGKIWLESNVDKGSTFYFTIKRNLDLEL